MKKYRILDNKLNESDYDLANLKLELDGLPDLNFGDLELNVEDMFPELKTDEFDPNNVEFQANKEIEEDDLGGFEHKCPKCGFEFNSSDED